MDSTYFERIIKNLKNRNFDNDIARIVNAPDRYGLEGSPIRIGTQPIIGSLAEAIIETGRMIDTAMGDMSKTVLDLSAQIEELRKEIEELKKPAPAKKAPAAKAKTTEE